MLIKLKNTIYKVATATATEVFSHGFQLLEVGTKVLCEVGRKLAIVKHPNARFGDCSRPYPTPVHSTSP